MNLDTKKLQELKELLSEPRKIALVCHTRPDGDAIGSMLGLAHYLTAKGHEVSSLAPSEYPEFINWLPGSDHVVCYSEETADVCDEIIEDSELLFCLDFSGLKRVGEMEELITNRSCEYVMIDHHLNPEDFDDYRYWSSDAAATAELVYLLIKEFGDLELITKDIAECLYTGILTDTGSFRHSNTTPQIHAIVSDLIYKGADNTKIHRKIYDTNSLRRLKLLGSCLSNGLHVIEDSRTAYVIISEKDHIEHDIQSGDTEGLVNYALSLDGIIFAVMIKWSEQYTKLSLRSKGEFPANEIAGKYFNGGGHRNASGGRFDGSIEETIIELEKAVKENRELLEDSFKELEEC